MERIDGDGMNKLEQQVKLLKEYGSLLDQLEKKIREMHDLASHVLDHDLHALEVEALSKKLDAITNEMAQWEGFLDEEIH